MSDHHESNWPACPPELEGAAREAWERFSQELDSCGIGSQLDAIALQLLCETYAAHVVAAEQVAKLGAVWIERTEPGKLPKFAYSPYWVIQKNEQKKLLTLLAEFGMTPSSRTRVSARPTETKLDKFLKKYPAS
jgi:P27 family predicted phage terminase small subunit